MFTHKLCMQIFDDYTIGENCLSHSVILFTRMCKAGNGQVSFFKRKIDF